MLYVYDVLTYFCVKVVVLYLFVLCHSSADDGSVSLVEFDSTMEGIVESSVMRWLNYDEQLEATWQNDKYHWPCPPSP